MGKNGLLLKEKWANGPRAYLGLAIAGFPNMFMVTGPGSPSVLTNVVPSIEQHVDFIAGLLEHARNAKSDTVEVEDDAENSWMDHHITLAGNFLRSGVDNWWNGGNIAGKPRTPMPYMGGF